MKALNINIDTKLTTVTFSGRKEQIERIALHALKRAGIVTDDKAFCTCTTLWTNKVKEVSFAGLTFVYERSTMKLNRYWVALKYLGE